MDKNPIVDIVLQHQNDANLGPIAKAILKFIDGSEFKVHATSTNTMSSLDIAKILKVRWESKRMKKEASLGIEESIKLLSEKDVQVRLAGLEGEKGWVNIWLSADSGHPLGMILINFELLTK